MVALVVELGPRRPIAMVGHLGSPFADVNARERSPRPFALALPRKSLRCYGLASLRGCSMANLRHRIALASSFVCAWLVLASGPEPAAAQIQGRQYSTAEIQGGYRLYASQ